MSIKTSAAPESRAFAGFRKVIIAMAYTSGGLGYFIGFLTFVDVICRELFGKPIPGVYDLLQYLMVYIIFFSFAYCELKGGNVKVDLLLEKMPKKMQMSIELFGALLAIFVFFMVMQMTFFWAVDAYKFGEITYGIKGGYVWPFKMAIPIGTFMILVLVIRRVVNLIKRFLGKGG